MKKIETYQFWCSLEYLHQHTKELNSESIFITDIRGNDCRNLRVTFIKLTDTSHPQSLACTPAG